MPLFILSVCVRVCDIEFVVFSDCESYARPISTNPVPMEAGEYGLSRGTWFHLPSRGGRGRWADVGLVMCFFFSVFHEFEFSNSCTSNTRSPAAREPEQSATR